MPSRFFVSRSRRLDPGGRRSQQSQLALSDPRQFTFQAPWQGFTPTLSPELTDFTFGANVSNLVNIEGVMGPAEGFVRVTDTAATTLPLGTNTPPASAGNEEPVVALFQDVDTSGVKRQYAITGDATLGHLYIFASGSWTNIPAAAAVTLTGSASSLTDHEFHPPSNQIFITNGVDPVLVHTPGGANYSEFSPSTLNPFTAQSCCNSGGRLLFFNTSESGTAFINRVRGTTVSGTPALTGSGSFQLDLDEIEGKGYRIRELGNVIVCYMEKGVAFLRRTLNPSSPFTRQYISHTRGLLGPFAACELGDGRHFGVFNEGWYTIDEEGVFREVGTRNLGNREVRLWHDEFYRRLNTSAEERVYVQRDTNRNIVYVGFPTDESDTISAVWIWDIDSDTIWPQDYNHLPNCFGSYDDDVTSLGYDDVSDTYEEVEGGYADFESESGRERVAFGTTDGLVFRYTPTLISQDGILPTYRYTTYRPALLGKSIRGVWDRLYLTYLKSSTSSNPVFVSLHSDAGLLSTQRILQNLGQLNTEQVEYVSEQSGGARFGIDLNGTHPFKLISIEANIRPEGVQVRRGNS